MVKPARSSFNEKQLSLLRALLGALIIAALGAMVLNLANTGLSGEVLLPYLVLILLLMGAILLLRAQRPQVAVGLVIVTFLLIQGYVLATEGVNSIYALLLSFLPLSLAGLLLGRWALILTALCSVLIVALMEISGIASTSAQAIDSWEMALIFGVITLAAAFLLDRFGITTHTALGEALNYQQELEREVQRRQRLQKTLSLLLHATTPQEIANIVVENVGEAVGSHIGTVCRVTEDGEYLEIFMGKGVPEDVYQTFLRTPMSASAPITDAIRSQQPVWINDLDSYLRLYPHYADTVRRNKSQALAALPLIAHGEAFGGISFSFQQAEQLSEETCSFLTEVTQQCALALDRVRFYEAEVRAREEVNRANARLEFLASASTTLAKSIDYQETLQTVAELVISRLADWCGVYLTEQGQINLVAVAHRDPAKVATVRRLYQQYPPDWSAPRGIANVMRTGVPEFTPYIPPELMAAAARDTQHLEMIESLGLHSMIIVPLQLQDHILGVVILASAESRRQFNEDDLTLTEELAHRAATAIEKARLYHEANTQRERLHVTLSSIGDAVISTDEQGKIAFMNKVAEALTGWQMAAAEGLPLDQVFHIINEESREVVESPLDKIIRTGVSIVGLANHTLLVAKDGSEVPIDDSGAAIFDKDGRMIGIVLVFRDIRDRKEAAATLQQKTREIAILEERQRLSRDLHDAVSQVLFTSSIIADTLPRISHDPEKLLPQVEKLRRLNRGAIAEMRGLLLELRKEQLESISIEELLKQLSLAKMGQSPVDIEVQVETRGEKLPTKIQITFYRIAQEALNNVVKHSSATRADLIFQQDDSRIQMTIRDNGVGFNAEDIHAASMGLSIMRERAEAVGARLEVESAAGQGTELRVEWIPPAHV